ncbi:hypothetical protein L596_003819 [Steinernema carpocapsae]|uniref:Uncharacterized protein n=1 Tax=Steinernema carpocapsae TaxID=34508 RepID=A0A4V6I7X0_STECR|nr:hypothetical protein L596_003819 [Steinernema carpocapsae]
MQIALVLTIFGSLLTTASLQEVKSTRKRWAALSYGGERYQFQQSDEPMDPYVGTAYAGQDIPFQRDDPAFRKFYDRPNPYTNGNMGQSLYSSTPSTNQFLMRDQRQNGLYMYYPFRTLTNGITSPDQVNSGR